MGIPAETKAFLLVPYQLGLRGDYTVGDTAVLGTIEYQNSPIVGHGGYDIWILGLVSGFVDLSWVIDPLFDVHLDSSLLAARRVAIATNLSATFIVVLDCWSDIFGQFDIGDLEVILSIVGCVCTYQQAMDCVVLSGLSGHISLSSVCSDMDASLFLVWEPLSSQGWPFKCSTMAVSLQCAWEGAMRRVPQNHIIKKWAVLLPCFVFYCRISQSW